MINQSLNQNTLVKLLISYGANVNVEAVGKSYKLYPLTLSVVNGNYEVSRILLEAGADTDAQDQTGKAAIHYAVVNQDESITKVLIKHQANIKVRHSSFEVILDPYSEEKKVLGTGFTPLLYAVTSGNTLFVKLLLLNGADANMSDRNNTLF